MPLLNTRLRRLLGRFLILVILAFLIDISWILHRVNTIYNLTDSRSAPTNNHGAHQNQNQDQNKERIFIASTHWNNEVILRSHWNTAILELVKSLGPENVYISIIESGSWDGTKNALRELDASLEQLGVERTISTSEITHSDEISKVPKQDEPGWIFTSRGRKELRRIPFLSRQRNDSLKPLVTQKESGKIFDKILFLNDVVFTNDDFYNLLDTNHGTYAAACALDFSRPPQFYDTFALRDSEGHEPLMQTWPYFRAAASRHFLERGEPTPVQSCWNSMVLMDATPFYDTNHPLHFRGISDSLAKYHLEGSECCIIHADNPLTLEKGVWLNPNVRVGYSGEAYAYVHTPFGWPSSSKWQIWRWTWENRLRRWLTTDTIKRWVVTRRLNRWQTSEREEGVIENGKYCLVNEMHVLVDNGWAHV